MSDKDLQYKELHQSLSEKFKIEVDLIQRIRSHNITLGLSKVEIEKHFRTKAKSKHELSKLHNDFDFNAIKTRAGLVNKALKYLTWAGVLKHMTKETFLEITKQYETN